MATPPLAMRGPRSRRAHASAAQPATRTGELADALLQRAVGALATRVAAAAPAAPAPSAAPLALTAADFGL